MPHGAATAPVGRRFVVEPAYLPRAFAAEGAAADPLRAHSFWTAQPRRCGAATLSDEHISALAGLLPHLGILAGDPRPEARSAYALCVTILARAGRAPSDREVWRALLGLSRYDGDPDVRAAAARALEALERLGTVPGGPA